MRLRLVAFCAGIGLLLGFVFSGCSSGGSGGGGGSTTSQNVTVPNSVGKTQASATSAITAAGLTVGTVTTQPSTTVPSGDVISESPAPGASVAGGSAVNLVVSSGPPITVPNVVGDTQAVATTAITAAGLTLGTVTGQTSATVPAGVVISESPAAGSSVASGSAVNLVVSSGPPPVTVPNVVGDTQATATTALTSAGLTIGTVTSTPSATVPVGTVISESPAAGSSVAPGSAVSLVISSGPPITVPNVVGDTQAAATTAITAAGLTLGTVTSTPSATVPVGTVISESPAAGSSVATGSAVSLVVSSGPPITVPNVVGDTQPVATTAITSAGLTLGTVSTQSSTTVPSGDVISESPAAGSIVATGSAVSLVVSSGTPQVTVPNVVGDTQAAATTAITTAGLTVGTVTTQDSPTVLAGNVISENPAAGASVAGGSAVNIVVSTGETETVLYGFTAPGDGLIPLGGIVQGSNGNFYGTTSSQPLGSGAVFELTPAGVETILYVFLGPVGAGPGAALIQGADGNFYGTTESGGLNDYGTVFAVTPSGTASAVYSFMGVPQGDAGTPSTPLIQGSDGNFYGTTQAGGPANLGTVFKVTPAGVETILHAFAGGSDGSFPLGGLVQGSDGSFYGTTRDGGTNCNGLTVGCGTLFKVTPQGVYTQLYQFTGSNTASMDGLEPVGSLIQASDGNFYGTTSGGGSCTATGASYGCGTVFKMTPQGVESVLYSFAGGSDGMDPVTIMEANDGNFYGVTAFGGLTAGDAAWCITVASKNGVTGCGTLFQLTPSGVETVLHAFIGGSDGSGPVAGLIQATDGHFYGVTETGGTCSSQAPYGCGTVFKY